VSTLHRERMSFEEWEALPDKPKAEWVDGEAVWSVSPTYYGPGRGQFQLASAFHVGLPDLKVVTEMDVVLPGNRIRIPDVSVVERPPADGRRIVEPPVIVAEVLSPSTRGQDLVTKSHEYAAAGIGQYWLLDPDGRTLDVFELVDGGWSPVLQLTEAAPAGSVRVSDHGVVEADLASLLDY